MMLVIMRNLFDELADDLIQKRKILVTKDEFNQVMKEATGDLMKTKWLCTIKWLHKQCLQEYLDGNANVEEISNEIC